MRLRRVCMADFRISGAQAFFNPLPPGCRKVFPEVYEDDGGNALTARFIQLSDAEETWADGAYIQTLTFTIGI